MEKSVTLQDVTAWAPVGATALCIWFIIRFISEADKFKEDTKKSIKEVVQANQDLSAVTVELKAYRAVDKSEVKHFLEDAKTLIVHAQEKIEDINKKTASMISTMEEVSQKNKEILKAVAIKTLNLEQDVKSIKIKLGDNLVMITEDKDKKKS
jgi:hypothetical protein